MATPENKMCFFMGAHTRTMSMKVELRMLSLEFYLYFAATKTIHSIFKAARLKLRRVKNQLVELLCLETLTF